MKRFVNMAIVGLGLVVATAAQAGAATILSYDNGWYRNDGLHSGGNTSTFTGFTAFGGVPFPAAYEHRGFYAFDLTGAPVASAISITFFARGSFLTDAGSESFSVNDYTGSVASLVAGSTVTNPFGDGAFNDLGAGLLGQYTITGQSGSMPEITVELSNAFVAQYNAALLAEQKVAVGTALTSGAYFTAQGVWGGNGLGAGAARLNITEVAADVPEPGVLLLVGSGLMALRLRGRRR